MKGSHAQAAISELRGWTPRVHAMFPWRMPDSWGEDITLEPLREHMVAGVRQRSLLLLGAVALVLLIAIVNVANLMIGQTAAQARRVRASRLAGRHARASSAPVADGVAAAGRYRRSAGHAAGVRPARTFKALAARRYSAARRRLRSTVRSSSSPPRSRWEAALLFGLLPAWRARSQSSTVPGRRRALDAWQNGSPNGRAAGHLGGRSGHDSAGWRGPVAAQLLDDAAGRSGIPRGVRRYRRAQPGPNDFCVAR